MKRTVTLKVAFTLPPEATALDAKLYVDAAVCTWKGSLKPPGVDEDDLAGDPMFELDDTTVKVVIQRAIFRKKNWRKCMRRK